MHFKCCKCKCAPTARRWHCYILNCEINQKCLGISMLCSSTPIWMLFGLFFVSVFTMLLFYNATGRDQWMHQICLYDFRLLQLPFSKGNLLLSRAVEPIPVEQCSFNAYLHLIRFFIFFSNVLNAFFIQKKKCCRALLLLGVCLRVTW